MTNVTDLAALPQPEISDERELTSIMLATFLSGGVHEGVKWDMVQGGYSFEFTATHPESGEILIRERMKLGPLLNAWANAVIERAKEQLA